MVLDDGSTTRFVESEILCQQTDRSKLMLLYVDFKNNWCNSTSVYSYVYKISEFISNLVIAYRNVDKRNILGFSFLSDIEIDNCHFCILARYKEETKSQPVDKN